MTTIALFFPLVIGAVLQLFGFGRWMTSVAAWVVPVFFLHFSHAMPLLAGALWIWFALACTYAITLRGIAPIPGVAYLLLPLTWGFFGALPFVIDKVVAPSLPGFSTTLIFPAAFTAVEFLNSRWNPYGTWGAVAYTQHGNLALLQLVAVTGLWGPGFVMAWFASVMNWAWEQQFLWAAIGEGVLGLAGTIGVIFLFGGLRIALAPRFRTIRVAGIGWPEGIVDRTAFMHALESDLTAQEREALVRGFGRIQDSFLTRTEREAQAGARIIVWPEACLMVFAENEAAFLRRARDIAKRYEIYLVIGMATVRPGRRHSLRNHAVLFAPSGEMVFDYTKITAVPGFEQKHSLPGDRPIQFADTDFGRLATPVCYDMDFESIIRQVGKGRVDIMLVPASDWKEITPLHQQMAEFRAIENGAALLRITRWGASGVVDPYGRRLAYQDDFSARDNVMVAQLPIRAGVRTVYAVLGNTFGWLCTAATFVSLVLVVLQAFAIL